MTFTTIQELVDALLDDSIQELDKADYKGLLQEPLDTAELDLLAEAAKKNTSITSLSWKMQDKYDNDTTSFYKAMAILPKLQTFNLDCSVVADTEYSGSNFSSLNQARLPSSIRAKNLEAHNSMNQTDHPSIQ
jgi:hypothetical protein